MFLLRCSFQHLVSSLSLHLRTLSLSAPLLSGSGCLYPFACLLIHSHFSAFFLSLYKKERSGSLNCSSNRCCHTSVTREAALLWPQALHRGQGLTWSDRLHGAQIRGVYTQPLPLPPYSKHRLPALLLFPFTYYSSFPFICLSFLH